MATKVATLPKVPSWAVTEARTGRTLQRYAADSQRGPVRLCCGCVPVFLSESGEKRVLLVSSRKKSWTLPKGGWEEDETAQEAASRETFEEAGVVGDLVEDNPLCIIEYESYKNGSCCRVRFYAMLVNDVLDHWPEQDSRDRIVVTVQEARQLISKAWMHEALDAVEAMALVPQRGQTRVCLEEGLSANHMKWITTVPEVPP